MASVAGVVRHTPVSLLRPRDRLLPQPEQPLTTLGSGYGITPMGRLIPRRRSGNCRGHWEKRRPADFRVPGRSPSRNDRTPLGRPPFPLLTARLTSARKCFTVSREAASDGAAE